MTLRKFLKAPKHQNPKTPWSELTFINLLINIVYREQIYAFKTHRIIYFQKQEEDPQVLPRIMIAALRQLGEA